MYGLCIGYAYVINQSKNLVIKIRNYIYLFLLICLKKNNLMIIALILRNNRRFKKKNAKMVVSLIQNITNFK